MLYDRKALVHILVYHWRADISRCGCGWAELGKSYPDHVADMYEREVRRREEVFEQAKNSTEPADDVTTTVHQAFERYLTDPEFHYRATLARNMVRARIPNADEQQTLLAVILGMQAASLKFLKFANSTSELIERNAL